MNSWLGPVIVTGTDTGVGKTVVTAALAATAQKAGLSVAALKPAQTGDDDDAAEIARLTGIHVQTLTSYPAPLAPLTAARVAQLPPLALHDVIQAVEELSERHDLILIEGAGGLLVSLGESWTIADVAAKLHAPTVVVARAGLGTLNHTALTQEALEARHIEHCVVIGSWPEQPELVHHMNLTDIGAVAGIVPAGASSLPPATFQEAAPSWLGPQLHGIRADTTKASGIRKDMLSG
ncbi:MAG: ATP-dependent dethiobiotin synthetase BioD [Corynebacteriales bacterium]|nr:ATP-dependent dethiobiotin synthetase BioD [Mycobacteriales bacterium]